ncbi:TPA: hypothetical protein ACKOLN_002482 [Clostridioides difficile]
MKVRLRNNVGMIKECKVGFSWTTFFFGFFPALFRGDWKWMIIELICACVTFGLSSIVFCFIYNKLYINDLLSKGYTPASDADADILINKGFLVANKEF